MSNFVRCTCVFTLATFLTSLAAAGTITGLSSVAGSGLGTVAVPTISTPSPGNDNVPGVGPDNNVAVPIKRFESLGEIDIEFTVSDNGVGSGGTPVTEYRFFESVDNNTGIDWSEYRMVLGVGVGSAFAPAPAGLTFDAPTYDPAPTSSAFAGVAMTPHMLTFSSGVHSTGAESYEVRIDVPNGLSAFTIRQIPTAIPEPATMALVMLAVMPACGWFVRRRFNR